MESEREELARLALDRLSHGHPISERDALQLRRWAMNPADAMLPLEEIARRILKHTNPSDES
jgi:hypothetical protein